MPVVLHTVHVPLFLAAVLLSPVYVAWWMCPVGYFTGKSVTLVHPAMCVAQALYNFVGNIEVLQPALQSEFTLPDETHAMLPPDAALYKLTEPTCPLPPTTAASTQQLLDSSSSWGSQQSASSATVQEDPFHLTLSDAVLAFMNCPHPLQTLSEARAYGPVGSISRYHNPANYTRALITLAQ